MGEQGGVAAHDGEVAGEEDLLASSSAGGAVKVGVPAEDEEDGVVAAEEAVVAHLVGGVDGEGGDLAGEA